MYLDDDAKKRARNEMRQCGVIDNILGITVGLALAKYGVDLLLSLGLFKECATEWIDFTGPVAAFVRAIVFLASAFAVSLLSGWHQKKKYDKD